jgi:TRAP transporter TAXI family solute receptor
VADLTGRRISVGEEGSASRTTALRVLAAHGLGPKDIVARNLGLGDALVALRQKEVDAVIQVIGMPADRIRDALAEIPLRLVPLSPRAVASLAEAKSGYFAFVIPRGAYATQKQDVPTIATAALLLAGTGLSDAEVVTLTRFVYEKGRDFTARGSAQGTQVGPATARLGLTVPQNAAAVRTLEAMTPK